jgi:large subunit ribosomal protein L6
MSKVGRKPINITGIQVDIKGQDIHFKGAKASGTYTLPVTLHAEKRDEHLAIIPVHTDTAQKDRDLKRIWGLHRSLLANKIAGAKAPFTEEVQIIGLGFKAAAAGKNLVLSLGYSHKIDFPLSAGVSVSIDKTGQKLTFESSDRKLLGDDVSRLKEQRPTEPYKGTGIKKAAEEIFRKDTKKK